VAAEDRRQCRPAVPSPRPPPVLSRRAVGFGLEEDDVAVLQTGQPHEVDLVPDALASPERPAVGMRHLGASLRSAATPRPRGSVRAAGGANRNSHGTPRRMAVRGSTVVVDVRSRGDRDIGLARGPPEETARLPDRAGVPPG
jgi:hypothetical protein